MFFNGCGLINARRSLVLCDPECRHSPKAQCCPPDFAEWDNRDSRGPVRYALRDRFGLVIATPTGKEVAVAAGVGLVLFVAEVSFLYAYFSGGSLAMVTTMVILIPVLASAIQFVLGGGLPHINEFLAYLLAAAAVLLISYVPSTPLS